MLPSFLGKVFTISEQEKRIVLGRSVEGCGPVIVPYNPASGPDYLYTKKLGLDSIWTGGAVPGAYSHAYAPNEYTTSTLSHWPLVRTGKC